VRRACIDIGSNTTRLLVAECDRDQLVAVHQERAFTHLGRGLAADGTIPPDKIAQAVEIVANQLRTAERLGAVEARAVATAAIRRAANGAEVVAAIRESCGVAVDVLSSEEEARLAFVGAARTLGHRPDGALGVVDVGGGSSELVVGSVPDQVSWSTSLWLGSAELTDRCMPSDPPSEDELAAARARVSGELAGLEIPPTAEVVAVGGSATSLCRLAGPCLDRDAFARSLALLSGRPRLEIAREFELDVERVRLLPAGLLILQAASELFGAVLHVARGGLREGVLLEATDG